MSKSFLILSVLTICTFFITQDVAADRRDDHDVLRRYENRGNLDYRTNWEYDRDAYLRGESPFQPSYMHSPNGYYYRGQYYQSNPPNDRNYHRGDWGDQANWRYNEADKDAYLRGVNDQSDYYRQRHGEGAPSYYNSGYYEGMNNYYRSYPNN